MVIKIQSAISLIIALTFFSCEKEKLPDFLMQGYVPKPVIQCYIYPGMELFEVRLHTTVSPLTSSFEIENFVINDAKVLLRNPANENLELFFDNEYNSYIARDSTFKVMEGQTYYLEVTEKNGQQHLASTLIPQRNPEIRFSIDSIPRENNTVYKMELLVPDQPDLPNFYYIEGWMKRYSPTYYLDTLSNRYYKEYLVTELFSDDRKDGIDFLYRNTITLYREYPLEISYQIMHLDKNSYEYWVSMNQFSYEVENIFSVDPSVVFSSFENAKGVFGSFVIDHRCLIFSMPDTIESRKSSVSSRAFDGAV